MSSLMALHRQALRRRQAWRKSPNAEEFNRYRERGRWKAMLSRCENPRAASYRYYGARGIKVCAAWHDFEVYYADLMRLLGPCPPLRTLDRIDNDGDYEPGNVRWATGSQQQANTRPRQRPLQEEATP